MPRIFVDGAWHEVPEGKNLLEACLSLGFDLPYFCWHPAMHSVGACRQCAVKQFRDEKDSRGKIVMACMTPADDGTRISISDPEARDFRARVVEWLMVGHPHDCPVCDEGGECHLQDMTVMTGHDDRRYRFRKRTFRNQELGPFLNHEMNRCIACYRCVRFYRDCAGGRDFHVLGAHHHVYFGRHEDGVLENEFSGNLVEVCPTGVFTDKTLKKHYARKWDLQTAPSVCVHCGVGCNTIPGERYGTLRRILNRYNGEVNGYFLCDRGRFGYEFVDGERRARTPLLSPGRGSRPEPIAAEAAARRFSEAVSASARPIGVGSPRASLEANFALRALVGRDRFCAGLGHADLKLLSLAAAILSKGPAAPPSLREAQACDAVLVLGEDLPDTAPRLALALRQAARQAPMEIARALKIPAWHDAAVRDALQDARGPFFVITPDATRLDDLASQTVRAAPDDVARLGFAVARELSPDAPPVPALAEADAALAARIAGALRAACRPLVVSGTGCGSEAVIRAAAHVAWALCASAPRDCLYYAVPEWNSMGLALLGGNSLEHAFREAAAGNVDAVFVLENDLYRRAGAAAVDEFLAAARTVVVVDHQLHATARRADLLLPAGTFAESDGTVVSAEGRAQRFFRVMPPAGDVRQSRDWICGALAAPGRPRETAWRTLDELTAALANESEIFRRVVECAPSAAFRIAGAKVPRQPQRYSGRTAMTADASVHEPRPPDDFDSPLSFSMEGYPGAPPPPLTARFWAPGWNSVQSANKFQAEVGGPMAGGDPGIRLVEPPVDARPRWFTDVPAPFVPPRGGLLAIPLHHVFGSEELSALAPGIASRAPSPYVALHPDDAAARELGPGDLVEIETGGAIVAAPLALRPQLARGTAGVPSGAEAWKGIALPAEAIVRKAGAP